MTGKFQQNRIRLVQDDLNQYAYGDLGLLVEAISSPTVIITHRVSLDYDIYGRTCDLCQ
jgi:hypothetical protein